MCILSQSLMITQKNNITSQNTYISRVLSSLLITLFTMKMFNRVFINVSLKLVVLLPNFSWYWIQGSTWKEKQSEPREHSFIESWVALPTFLTQLHGLMDWWWIFHEKNITKTFLFQEEKSYSFNNYYSLCPGG